MHSTVDLIFSCLLLGGIYGMGAMGMALIFGVMRVLNLAHGAFMVLGGALACGLAGSRGIGLFLAGPALLLVSIALGALLWQWGLSSADLAYEEDPQEEGSVTTSLLVTLGVTLVVEDVVNRWGPAGSFALSLPPSTVALFGVSFSTYKLVLFGLVVTGFLGFTMLLFKTDFGYMVRASIQDRKGAILAGVPIGRISLAVFSLGSGVAALAGALYAGVYPMTAHDGIPLSLKALFVVILGGMGSLSFVLPAAIFLGSLEVLAGFWGNAEMQAIIPYTGLALLLIMSPGGLAAVGREFKKEIVPRGGAETQ